MKKFFKSLIFKLLVAVAIGFVIGFISTEPVINVINTIKYVLGQIIYFAVPLIIIGFIAPAIAQLRNNASKLLGYALLIAYLSSIGAAFMATFGGYAIIPKLNIVNNSGGVKELPEMIFKLEIPPVMSVMSALLFSILIGLATAWTKSELTEKLLVEFKDIILAIVNKVVIPIIPIYTASTFATLAYQGSITTQLPIFLKAIVIIIIGHFIWLAVLYLIAGAISGKNPARVFKYYGPAYLTAIGTMSSAATLPVALDCAKKSDVLRDDITDFTIPLCANIHLCGSALTITFVVMTVSQVLYGKMPSVSTMVLFVLLLGIFAIGAPGVPGGAVMASLGIVTGVLGFDDAGVALLLSIFALQDSFGTACNVTGDGAIALMLTAIADKKGM